MASSNAGQPKATSPPEGDGDVAAERLSMRCVKEVLRQKRELKKSHREVAQSLGISLGAISRVVGTFPADEALSIELLDARGALLRPLLTSASGMVRLEASRLLGAFYVRVSADGDREANCVDVDDDCVLDSQDNCPLAPNANEFCPQADPNHPAVADHRARLSRRRTAARDTRPGSGGAGGEVPFRLRADHRRSSVAGGGAGAGTGAGHAPTQRVTPVDRGHPT